MRKIRIKQNKKAISIIVSYVLLIVIALALAAGIYTWLKSIATEPDTGEKCPEDVALIIKSYECDSHQDVISITVQNSGFFNIDGFFIRASKEQDKLATIPLIRTDITNVTEELQGRYDFSAALQPNQIKTTPFSYSNALPEGLGRIELQSFIYSEDRVSTCKTVSLNIPIGKNCN